jgi:AcrR family transcriptional regulator
MPPAKRRPAPSSESSELATRVARRERRRERSREEILDAARRVLLRSGVAATTLEAVAREVGVSKPTLYYYFASKNALLFELIFGALTAEARAIHDGVEKAQSGAEALRVIIRESVNAFTTPSLDDFRLAFLHGQIAAPGSVHFDAQQFARIRPLNDLRYAGAAKKLREEQQARPSRANVQPRLMAFLAWISAIGLLTVKGMVESLEDPLIYSDEQLIEGLARIFEAAATP